MTSALKSALNTIKQGVSSLGSNLPTLQITFDPETRLKLVQLPSEEDENDKVKSNDFVPVYSYGNDIIGHLDIILNGTQQLEYDEVAIYLVGQVECNDLNRENVFLSQKILLNTNKGILKKNTEFDFKFTQILTKIDSFYGSLFECRYLVRAVIQRSKAFQSNIQLDSHFIVRNTSSNICIPKPMSMQVGVSECLHIKFHYDNINLPTDGCITGTVEILANTLKIITMQLQLIRREVIKTGRVHNPEMIKTKILGTFEIMDGFPADNETIPIRLHLQRFTNISSSQKCRYFSVQYFVNLGLIDMEGRKYFKTCELNIHRTKLV